MEEKEIVLVCEKLHYGHLFSPPLKPSELFVSRTSPNPFYLKETAKEGSLLLLGYV